MKKVIGQSIGRVMVASNAQPINPQTIHRNLSSTIRLVHSQPLSRASSSSMAVKAAITAFSIRTYIQKSDVPPASPAGSTTRMQERMIKYGVAERPVTPDGNCQFRALADQLHQDQDRHTEVRSEIIDWLKRNEGYHVSGDNSACLGDFLDRDQFPSWESYCRYMAVNKAWGDHLTLVAATETFKINLWILSNVDVGESSTPNNDNMDQYITTISPRVATPTKTVLLAHYHEMHYTSLEQDRLDSPDSKILSHLKNINMHPVSVEPA